MLEKAAFIFSFISSFPLIKCLPLRRNYEGVTISKQVPLHLSEEIIDWCFYHYHSENIFVVHASFSG